MEKENPNNKHDFLKVVYEQGAEHHRHYLSWREKLTAGYIAIVATLLIALSWLYKNAGLHDYLFLVFLLLVFISYGFRELERRNHCSSIDVQNVLLTIEKEFKLQQLSTTNENTALFFTIDNSLQYWKSNSKGKKHTEHSYIITFTFNAVMIFSAFATLGCIFWFNLHLFQKIFSYEFFQVIFKIILFLIAIGIIIFAIVKGRAKRITLKDIKPDND